MTEVPTPPSPKRVDHRREYHGDVFNDPYEWMRDKSDPDVIAYLEAENSYTEQITDHLAPLRQKIFDEIKARTKETDLSVPVRRGDWWYYARSYEGKQYGVQCRCAIADPTDWNPPVFDEHTEIPGEQTLLDENVEAEGHDFFSLGAASISPDGNILAYSVDVVGDELVVIANTGDDVEIYDDETRTTVRATQRHLRQQIARRARALVLELEILLGAPVRHFRLRSYLVSFLYFTRWGMIESWPSRRILSFS